MSNHLSEAASLAESGFPGVATPSRRRSRRLPKADAILKAAAGFWFIVAVIGQLIFVGYIASFYGRSLVEGDLSRWNRIIYHGYIPGDRAGNFALGIHLLMAAMITLSGVLQLIPQLRARAPAVHRWNGRFYILTAFATSIAALYLVWIRGGVVGDLPQHLGVSLDALLIMLCATMALRYALARDFRTHRRWALRLFLVVSGVWFFRVGLMLWFLIFKGPVGFDPITFQGPLPTALSFAQSLLPLAVLELYLRTQDRAGPAGRVAMATGLFVLTLAMGAGIAGASMGMWLPNIEVAYDSRKSIAAALTPTIAYQGVDAAVRQYQETKAASPAAYDFDEDELDTLGYHLLHIGQFKNAVRIFQLNVEAHPQSGNAYDSLAEAYMDDGDKAQAIADYHKSLQLKPTNRNAARMLRRLDTATACPGGASDCIPPDTTR
ncbi:MAG: hypothetical protein JWR07_2058 [Nevskia sp.]|nr:hypothetical protein [Nevskia sp.]